MELTCLAPKIASLKFLRCSSFYAGVYCIRIAPTCHQRRYQQATMIRAYLQSIDKTVKFIYYSGRISTLYNVCAVPWGVLSTVGVCSTVGGIMSTVGDILSTLGVFSTVGDIMINVGDILSTVGGVI